VRRCIKTGAYSTVSVSVLGCKDINKTEKVALLFSFERIGRIILASMSMVLGRIAGGVSGDSDDAVSVNRL